MKKVFLFSTLAIVMAFSMAEAKSRSQGVRAKAKKECLEVNASLSGKELQKCIKGKLK